MSRLFNNFLLEHVRILSGRMHANSISFVNCFHTQKFQYCPNRQSTLHVSGERAQTVFGVLSPYIDISKTMQNLQKLEWNIGLRKMNLDVKKLFHLWKELEQLKSVKLELEKERADIASAMKTIAQGGDKSESEKVMEMKTRGRKIREQLKTVAKNVLDLEDSLILGYLQLPNSLHHSVDVSDKVLFSLFSKPNFEYEAKGHETLGKLNNELEFIDNSPTAYYLKNKLAMLELASSEYFASVFRNHGYLNHSNPDFAKGVIIEGSGINVSEIEHKIFALTTNGSEIESDTQYLVGGASLQAFSSYFTKQIISNADCLPQKLITVGRSYSPSDKRSGLFSSWQTVSVDGFVLFENTSSAQEAMINETLMALVQCFTQLKIHFQVMQYGARNLKLHESAAIGILMYSPATETYQEIGRISVCGDFISKRLLMLKKLTKSSASFLSAIHVRVCNITHLLAFIIENGQNESGSYDAPEVLQKFMDMSHK